MMSLSLRLSPGSYDCTRFSDGAMYPQPQFGSPRVPSNCQPWYAPSEVVKLAAPISNTDSTLYSPAFVKMLSTAIRSYPSVEDSMSLTICTIC